MKILVIIEYKKGNPPWLCLFERRAKEDFLFSIVCFYYIVFPLIRGEAKKEAVITS